jgi:hypothetical protein
MQPVAFDVQGIVPIAYTAFAVALGTAAGAIVRKTLPAMGITLAVFTGIRVTILELARPHYQAALVANQQVKLTHLGFADRVGLHDWILSQATLDRAGHAVADLPKLCPNLHTVPQCVRAHGVHLLQTWQPASRFWLFQGIEAATFTALTLSLVALAIWWVRSRIT